MADEPAAKDEEPIASEPEYAECLRCHLLKPVDDEGFCVTCAQAMEQACL
jgi:hypothetical protein